MYKLLKNWKVVILSLAGATTFWFFNALNKDYSARINYPIEFLFERDSVVVMQPLPTTITVDVASGGWNLIRRTFLFNITPIHIDLDNPTEISYYTSSSLFPLVTEQLRGLTVKHLVTDTVFINIEQKKRRRVILRVDSLTVPLAPNHRITSPIVLSQDTVELIGPKSFIDSIRSTYLFPLMAKRVNDPFNSVVEVGVPNPELISVVPKTVVVSFQVERFEEVRVKVPVEAINFPRDSSVWMQQDFVEVVFMVPRAKRKDYSPTDFAVTVDLSMRNKADSTVIAMLMFYPEEVADIYVVPENVKLKYE